MDDTLLAFLTAASDDDARRLIRLAGGTPLRDGPARTFLFIGEADAVGLHHWMDIFPALPPFTRHSGTDRWHLTIDLPEAARVEYKLSVKRRGRRRLVLDSLNPRRARDPFGTNSLVTGPGYHRPVWSLVDSSVPTGSFETLEVDSAVFKDTRPITVYLPPQDANGPVPLLVAHDGGEYVEYAALATVLDNLIAAGDVPPLACVLTVPVARTDEYTADDRHARHLVDEVLPRVGDLVGGVGSIVAMGASLGGVASLHAAWRFPGTFDGLILHSGSFVTALGGPHRRGPVFAPVVDFLAAWRTEPGPLPGRIYLSCGRFDGLIADNRVMVRHLRSLDVDVAYDEAADGHNWENWRDHLRAGLIHAFGG
ncbi:MAG: enterochelin esterase [Acidimicrobiia bacterium]|nr:enterochelin esterase [Acidimicrobiia bacterium]